MAGEVKLPGDLSIWPDAQNPNNLRIVKNGASLCKVYGWDPDDARAKADMIVSALKEEAEDGDNPIKAAYMRGWNDREADILERAQRICP